MTKEELEKEAEENSFRYTLDKPWACEVERKQIMAHFGKGYFAGAEPREKRIAELEQQIEKMKCCWNCFYNCEDCEYKDCDNCPCNTCVEHNYWKIRR